MAKGFVPAVPPTFKPKLVWHRDTKEAFLRSLTGTEDQACIRVPWPLTSSGYTSVRVDGENHYAHRFVCILAHGDPPTNTALATHSCGNGRLGCVNPNHLIWGTHKSNSFDVAVHGLQRDADYLLREHLARSEAAKTRQFIPSFTPNNMDDKHLSDLT